MNKQVNAFAKNAITQFGLSEKMAKQFMGTYGAMSKSFGFSEESAYEMSKTVTGLVGDVASFYNISQDLASIKLKAIWTGETEGLKDLGVVMTQTALEEYALQKGMGKTISKMSEAEKVALRYYFVQDKLSGAMGDFARTSDGWANQTRVLSLRFEQLKATLGQSFIVLFTPIVRGINVVLAGLQKVADVFNAFVSKIFGKQSNTISNVSTSYSDLGSSAIDSANDIVSASKKAQKAVMGYDKLNILSNKKDSGSNSKSNSSATPNIASPSVSLDTSMAEENITNLDNIFNKINFKPLIDSFKELKNSIIELGGNIWDGLKWAYENILKPLAKFSIEKALPIFFNLLSGALKILNPILTTFGNIFRPVWNDLLKPLAKWTGGIVVSVLGKIADKLNDIGNWMKNNQSTVDKIVSSLLIFFGLWELTKISAFIQMAGGLSAAFSLMTSKIWGNVAAKVADKAETIALTLMYAKDFVLSIVSGTAALAKQAIQWVATTALKIADTTATVAGTAATWLATAATTAFGVALKILTSPITLVIGAIALLVIGIYELIKHWDSVKEAASKCWEWIVKVWNKASTWFNSTIIQPIGNFFSGMWDGLKTGAHNAWEGIKSIFGNVASFFKNIFTNAWQGVKAVFSVGGKIFDGIKEGIVKAFTTVVNAIIKGINKVVKVPFDGINWALNKIRKVDILGLKPFDWISTIKVPQIPMLAEGAWFKARNPRLAIVGEGKENEIVAPESKIEDAVERGNKKNNNQGTTRFEFVIYVEYEDGKKIIKKINDTQIKEGKILLNI